MVYKNSALRAFCVAGVCGLVVLTACNNGSSEAGKKTDSTAATVKASPKDTVVDPPAMVTGPVDTALYNKLLKHLANGDSSGRWPVKTVYPNAGAILPFKRIIAYYGNLYSKRMGVLGE